MSRQWAHWHGLELQITSAAQMKFIGVAKKTRTCRVVATIYHSHCRGSPEALLLRIKGVNPSTRLNPLILPLIPSALYEPTGG